MKVPESRGNKTPTSKTPSARSGLHLIELLANGSHENLQMTQGVASANGCSLQSDGKASC